MLNVVDNSGVFRARCIHIYKKAKQASPGDKVLVAARGVRTLSKVKKGQIFKALVVCCPFRQRFLGGHFTQATVSSVVLLKKNGDILGTRFTGPVYWKLHRRRLSKALSLFDNLF